MAARNRRKAPGRIAVLVATGLASASFLFAIVNTPTSSQATLQAAPVAQVSTSAIQPATATPTSTGSTVSQTSSAQTSAFPSTTSTARLRTRGS